MERLVKLVRDDIGKHLTTDSVVYKTMPPGEYIEALRKKLCEESTEYIFNPTAEELADILESVVALAEHDLCIGLEHLNRIRLQKHEDRGGFDLGMGMYVNVTEGRFS